MDKDLALIVLFINDENEQKWYYCAGGISEWEEEVKLMGDIEVKLKFFVRIKESYEIVSSL